MTWSCLLTPPGRGAIAVIQTTHDPSPFVGSAPERPAHRRFVVNGAFVDDVVVRRATALTGEPAWEVCCHGGPEPVRAILEALGGAIEPDALLRRAREAGAIDAIQEEAWQLLPQALTPRGAEVLWDQAQGALSRAILEGRTGLRGTATFGIALTSPPRVAIVGRPNAGKSTLLNAFARRERALVSDRPGTTRDPVEEVVAVDGVPLRMIDTAGVRDPETLVERWSVERALEEAARADLIVHLIDATDPRSDPELERFPNRLVVRNKVDAAGGEGISAKTGAGIEALGRAILSRLGIRTDWPPGAAILFTRALAEGEDNRKERKEEDPGEL